MVVRLYTQTRNEIIVVPIKKRWSDFALTNHCVCFKSDYDEFLIQDSNRFYHMTLGLGELRGFSIANTLSEFTNEQARKHTYEIDGKWFCFDSKTFNTPKEAFVDWIIRIETLVVDEDYLIIERDSNYRTNKMSS